MIEANTSPPSSKSMGEVILKYGSANAKFEYRSFTSVGSDCFGKSPVMVGSTQARTDNAGSDAKRGCTVHSTRPNTLDTATPDRPLIGAVQRERLRPKRSAQSLVIALICDAQSTRARIVCMDPARSRTCTNAVPNNTAVAGRIGDGRTAVHIDTVAGGASVLLRDSLSVPWRRELYFREHLLQFGFDLHRGAQ
ncbi:hypothetical protein AGLY_018052 [Aphis glycines]|uniref:Uncharacterized protein n=1 Tax=Aphis glycines TaxID=307491 RepID=A0A6G0STF7_APHGL|nr:hypothetical protein AGLY_018052 [Aphis glycines]